MKNGKVWYYEKDNKSIGPISHYELQKRFDSHELDINTLVWCEELTDWVPASDTGRFRFENSPVPPVLPKAKKRRRILRSISSLGVLAVIIGITYFILYYNGYVQNTQSKNIQGKDMPKKSVKEITQYSKSVLLLEVFNEKKRNDSAR